MLNEEDLSEHLSLCSIERICEQRPINFSFSELNSHQVQSALENLKVNKAAGWDSTCIRTGQWPEDWKNGEWSTVYKKDDRLAERNYRQITLLSSVEQLLSRQVHNQFENIFDSGISAYLKMHSCETTLSGLTEKWKLAMVS